MVTLNDPEFKLLRQQIEALEEYAAYLSDRLDKEAHCIGLIWDIKRGLEIAANQARKEIPLGDPF